MLKTKVDYYGIAVENKIVCTSNAEGRGNGIDVTASDSEGSVIARTVSGLTLSPSNDYKFVSAVTFGGSGAGALQTLKMGALRTFTDGSATRKIILTGWTINTSAGSPATLSVSGTSVNADATQGGTYDTPECAIALDHKAQFLMGVGTLSGAGCHLTSASYSGSATPSFATKDGNRISYGIGSGTINATLTFSSNGTNIPTFTPGEGWTVTQPVTENNGDGAYPTYTVMLIRDLAKTDAPSGT